MMKGGNTIFVIKLLIFLKFIEKFFTPANRQCLLKNNK